MVLYPNDGYHLEQVYMFDLVHEGEAEIGENMGTILAAAYGSIGGVNLEQAGYSQTAFHELTLEDWRAIASKVKRKDNHGPLRHIEGNVGRGRNRIDSEMTRQANIAKEFERIGEVQLLVERRQTDTTMLVKQDQEDTKARDIAAQDISVAEQAFEDTNKVAEEQAHALSTLNKFHQAFEQRLRPS